MARRREYPYDFRMAPSSRRGYLLLEGSRASFDVFRKQFRFKRLNEHYRILDSNSTHVLAEVYPLKTRVPLVKLVVPSSISEYVQVKYCYDYKQRGDIIDFCADMDSNKQVVNDLAIVDDWFSRKNALLLYPVFSEYEYNLKRLLIKLVHKSQGSSVQKPKHNKASATHTNARYVQSEYVKILFQDVTTDIKYIASRIKRLKVVDEASIIRVLSTTNAERLGIKKKFKFERIASVRNACMHFNIVTSDDVLFVINELNTILQEMVAITRPRRVNRATKAITQELVRQMNADFELINQAVAAQLADAMAPLSQVSAIYATQLKDALLPISDLKSHVAEMTKGLSIASEVTRSLNIKPAVTAATEISKVMKQLSVSDSIPDLMKKSSMTGFSEAARGLSAQTGFGASDEVKKILASKSLVGAFPDLTNLLGADSAKDLMKLSGIGFTSEALKVSEIGGLSKAAKKLNVQSIGKPVSKGSKTTRQNTSSKAKRPAVGSDNPKK